MAQTLNDERTTFNAELNNLDIHLQHIKEIVMLQKDLSGLTGVVEKVYLPEIIELAIQMSSVLKMNIRINKNFNHKIYAILERAKLLQILVNIIRNAKESLLEFSDKSEKEITISLEKNSESNQFIIMISDNGIGINQENLTKIFSMGFTTKPTGHGFGLHSSALTAKELGGSLNAESLGKNQGATFILTLPLEANAEKGAHHEPVV